jgi:hypothetical protein
MTGTGAEDKAVKFKKSMDFYCETIYPLLMIGAFFYVLGYLIGHP